MTFTGNPRWKEIDSELFDGQGSAVDRPDLVTRVFRLKLQSLMKDIAGGAFGPLRADVWVIEYQKRGLPHAHIVL